MLVALGKLLLISHNEILAISDDSLAYARQAFAGWTLSILPPGYASWLKLCDALAVPQRICIELLYLLSAFVFALVTRKCLGQIGGLAFFTLMAFAPFTYFLLDHGWSDGFFACLSVLALGATAAILMAESAAQIVGRAFALGLVLGLMAITRNEDPLLAFWVLALVAACAVKWPRESGPMLVWSAWSRPLTAGLVCGAACWLVIGGISFSFYLADGVFTRDLSLMPQHSRLLRNLAEIKTGEPQVRFIPISSKSRKLAYRVSPTLAKLEPLIEDQEDVWHVASREVGLPAGEIGGGWIWQTFNAKMHPLSGKSPAAMEATYKQANEEIESAFRNGRLQKRLILHPLIGDPGALLRQLPGSISLVASAALTSLPGDIKDAGIEPKLFDREFVRRADDTPKERKVDVQGWAFVNSPGRKIQNVVIGSDEEQGASVEQMDRPDVDKGFLAQAGWKPHAVGFKSTVESASPDNVRITYVLDDGSHVEGTHLKQMMVSKLVNAISANSDVLQGIDYAKEDSGGLPQSRTRRIQDALVNFSNRSAVHWIAFIVVLLGVGVMLKVFLGRQDACAKSLLVLIAFALPMWCLRILLYSLIDATAWNANQIRYLAPANALGFAVFALSVTALPKFALKPRPVK
jgi:hypothetical protein